MDVAGKVYIVTHEYIKKKSLHLTEPLGVQYLILTCTSEENHGTVVTKPSDPNSKPSSDWTCD